jgi:hypothetical protein
MQREVSIKKFIHDHRGVEIVAASAQWYSGIFRSSRFCVFLLKSPLLHVQLANHEPTELTRTELRMERPHSRIWIDELAMARRSES